MPQPRTPLFLFALLVLVSTVGCSDDRLGEPDFVVSSPADEIDRFEISTGYAYATAGLPLDATGGSWEVMCVPSDIDAADPQSYDCGVYLRPVEAAPLAVVRFSAAR